jgi:hypothetical protein
MTLTTKGRQAADRKPGGRLTADAVREIRNMLSYGATLQSAADRFGVTRNSIFAVKHGRTWKHVK